MRDVLSSYYKMTKTNFIIGLVVLVLILLFVNFSKVIGTSLPDDMNEMTAGQLLDVKLEYDKQISILSGERQEVIDIYNIKRWRVNTGTTATGHETKAKEVVEQSVSTNVEWNELGL